jgi:hypothetical protein
MSCVVCWRGDASKREDAVDEKRADTKESCTEIKAFHIFLSCLESSFGVHPSFVTSRASFAQRQS